MTPERLTQLVPNLLKVLSPSTATFPQGNPASAYRWVEAIEELPEAQITDGHHRPLWPEPPTVEVNTYTISAAPEVELLPGVNEGPVQFINTPGANPLGTHVPALSRCRRVHEQVIIATGELNFECVDLTIPGPLPFSWKRYYRSSIDEDSGIGAGWRHSLSEQLLVQDNQVELFNAEGRKIQFQLPAIGHGCYNRFERLLLFRQSLHSYRLSTFNEPDKIFRADGVNSALPLTEIRDQFGNSLTIDYSEGLPRKIVSSWGRVLDFESRGGRLTKLMNNHAPDDQRNLCSYEFQGGLLTEVHSNHDLESYHYHDLLLVQAHSGVNGKRQFEYDLQGHCHRLIQEESETLLTWQHNRGNCQVENTDRTPQQLHFNQFGQLTKERQGQRQKSWLYDCYGNLCQQINADGQHTFFRYDEFGRLRRITEGSNSKRYLYSEDGYPQAVQLSEQQSWLFTYSDKGRPQAIIDPEQQEWKLLYSDRGLLSQITDPEGGCIEFTWDGQGQLQTVRRGEKQWGFEYDHWQRMTTLVVNGETWREWRYGPTGELRESHIGSYQYGIDYCERGQPHAIHASNSQSLQWDYDSCGRICQIHFADGNQWALHHNTQGQLTQLQTPSGDYCWQYDGLGQLISHRTPDERQLTWNYSVDGSLSEYCDNDCRWYFHYYDRGTLASIRNNNGQINEFHYDTEKRLIQANNLHSSVRFKYDRRNRVIAENHDSSDVRDFSLRYQYDSRGWLRSASSDNLDLAYTLTPCGALYGVDANGEPVLRSEFKEQNTIHIQGEVRSTVKHRFGSPFSLESGLALAWQFDKCPPLQLTTPIRQTGFPQAQIDRDKRGNVVAERQIPGRRDYQYQYDGWGLMSTAECGDFKTHFRYDPFGRRLSKTCTHRKSSRQRRVTSSWSGLGIWAEAHQIDGKSRGIGHWITHPLNGSVLCHWSSGRCEYYHTDSQGKPLAIFDAQGTVQWSQGKDVEDRNGRAFGQTPGPWRGIGLIADIETGLWYTTSGYWNPALQMWLNGSRIFSHTTSNMPLIRL
ncbi:DUF6531 domain-containing protein [Microbulbifer variabilis]|uniref:DUF6531 domain-containing protein n=1 Tax=Microbulbifer variabilis TaxID=266805 RepID=A0ABY4VC09_9GAMM|nr:DUF6531 domain-containing protein [Microbulbifer variabilis]USD21817.1 DUF6531 domain-containing protein [Microbulbifer variabilis]